MPFKSVTTPAANIMTVDFDDNELFQQLNFNSYEQESGYKYLGIEDLSDPDFGEDDKAIYGQFLYYLSINTDGYDHEKVLLVKIENHIIDTIYNPSIFAKEGEDGRNFLVVKCGDNEFKIKRDGGKFMVGSLEGRIYVKEFKKSNDEKYTVPYIKFKSSYGEYEKENKIPQWVYTIKIRLDKELCDSVGVDGLMFESLIDQGEFIENYVAIAPSSGGNYVKFMDLGVGEFQISQITQDVHEQYGTGYLLKLSNGKIVRANKAIKDMLGGNRYELLTQQLQNGKPWSLIVFDVKESKDGKQFAKVALQPRLPRMTQNEKVLRPNTKELPGITPTKTINVESVEVPEKKFDRAAWLESAKEHKKYLKISDKNEVKIIRHLFVNSNATTASQLADTELAQFVRFLSENPTADFENLEPQLF